MVDGRGSGILFDIKRFALHDGPGIRTTVFLKGCPLSCVWCHNPESQEDVLELMFREEQCVGCGACVPACPVGAIAVHDRLAQTDHNVCTTCGECVAACLRQARSIAGDTWHVGQV
ncbi:4Fe-4S binding protein, partial [Candidatus Bipolaricaulota bacterium]|nr:4Fe-4S binding protein [Candidatus Bipolaricaulota bacterium]